MRTVALCGFSEKSWGPAFELDESIELWSVNHAYRLGFPRIDVLFEMHQIEQLKDPHYYQKKDQIRHIEYLSNALHPVYMLDHVDEFPVSIRYPIEDAIARYPHADFTSSFDYMMALVILAGDIEKVLLYGFEMDSNTEWGYQRPSAKEWIERSRAAGIEVSGKSGLLEKRRLYGYEAAEMISRQTAEAHKQQYEKQFQENLTKLHIFEGMIQEASKNGNKQKLDNYAAKVREFTIMTAKAEAAIEVCNNFIDECDLIEVEPILVKRMGY